MPDIKCLICYKVLSWTDFWLLHFHEVPDIS